MGSERSVSSLMGSERRVSCYSTVTCVHLCGGVGWEL